MHNLVSIAQCKEKGKTVIRWIEQIDKTPERALWIYDKICSCPVDTGWKNVVTLQQLVGPDTVIWQVDDVGVMCLYFGVLPHVHIFFWDRRLRGREKMCRLLAQMVMRQYGFTELWTMIPQGLDVITAFARRVGFKLQRIEAGCLILRVSPRELHDATTRE